MQKPLDWSAKLPDGHVLTQLLVLFYAKVFSITGHLKTQVSVLLSAKYLFGQTGIQVHVVKSPNVNGFKGHWLTQRQVELSANDELGQIVRQVLDKGSAYVPDTQNGMHLIVLRLPNDPGYVGHLDTHFIVELSAKRPPEQDGIHFFKKGSA